MLDLPVSSRPGVDPEAPASLEIRAALVLVIAGAALHIWLFRNYTADDAFISFRYAENLVSGLGLVFNPGQRLEGYTNFLWVLILAALKYAGIEPLVAAKTLGTAFALFTVYLTYKLTNRIRGSISWAGIVAASLVAGSPPSAAWGIGGLETPLFAALVTAALSEFVREGQQASKVPWSALWAGLSVLTRPDGAILAAALGASAFLRHGRSRATYVWFSLVAGLAVPHAIWRLYYYGSLLPNTFYAKTGKGLLQFAAGLVYTNAGIRNHGGYLFFFAAVGCALLPNLGRRAYPVVAFILPWLAYCIYKGHDPLSPFRFFVPLTPAICASACAALAWLIPQLRPDLPALPRVLGGLFALTSVGASSIQSYASRTGGVLTEYQVQVGEWGRLIAMGKELLVLHPEPASIAVIDAGAIPYFTGWHTIDRWGLLDWHTARLKSSGSAGEKFDTRYVLDQRPTFIQTHTPKAVELSGDFSATWGGDAELFRDLEFRRDYVRMKPVNLTTVFVRRDAVRSLTSSSTAEE